MKLQKPRAANEREKAEKEEKLLFLLWYFVDWFIGLQRQRKRHPLLLPFFPVHGGNFSRRCCCCCLSHFNASLIAVNEWNKSFCSFFLLVRSRQVQKIITKHASMISKYFLMNETSSSFVFGRLICVLKAWFLIAIFLTNQAVKRKLKKFFLLFREKWRILISKNIRDRYLKTQFYNNNEICSAACSKPSNLMIKWS